MKKKLTVIMTLMCAVLCAFALVACGGNGGETPETGHTHSFTVEKPDARYLKSPSGCLHKAVYYKSCECGEKGTEMFEYGEEPSGHDFGTGEVCVKCSYHKPSEGLEYAVNGNTAYLKSLGSCTDTVVYIADTYHGCLVTSIGDSAFSGCSGLTSITIPNGVTSIGGYAFSGCSGLTSVTVPNGITSIGDSAYSGCSGLTSITVPNGVTNIGDSAFSGCTGLAEICFNAAKCGDLNSGSKLFYNSGKSGDGMSAVFGDNVTRIPAYLFSVFDRLTSIKIHDSVTSIGDWAFYGCRGLTSITIPVGVASIGEAAFSGCSGLTSITVESENTTYHSASNCLIETESKTLTTGCKSSVIPQDGSVTSIGDSAFSGCSGLKSITIPDSVTSIGDWAFGDCIGLTSLIIPNGVTSIGDSAFSHCGGLKSITIPDSVTSIGDWAFGDCIGLTSLIIPNGVTSIGHGIFSDCSGLKSITIPNSVTSIGNYAFYRCRGLTSITIPDGVTSIGEQAFYGCRGLTSITIPDGVTSIGEQAFYGCSVLANITIPNSVTSIGDSAFFNCSGLTSITFNGTTAQWNGIEKGDSWDRSTGEYTVHCTDGDIVKS